MSQKTTTSNENDNQWQDICDLESIVPNSGVCALINDKQIAIFRIGQSEEVYAVDNFDPIGNANVLSRGIIGDIQGEIVVASPLYKQHFSLKSGQCLEDEDVTLNTYASRVHQGKVQIS